jgi:hypothetical protein
VSGGIAVVTRPARLSRIAKPRSRPGGVRGDDSTLSTRGSGGPRRASAFEARERRRRAQHLDQHAVSVVAHAAAEPETGGQPVDERAQAHTLHGAAHVDRAAFDGVGLGEHRSASRPRCQPGQLRLEFGDAPLQLHDLVAPPPASAV